MAAGSSKLGYPRPRAQAVMSMTVRTQGLTIMATNLKLKQ
ncbi:tRNA-5-taurinomethyluridine 2-sulfurtransferase [Psidium guajava]|nr:tRNA-5-taurinomethyluridine 2-sulfurtransferase [Psidium guajava]